MNLILKFNAALIGIFVVGFLIAALVSNSVLLANAREEVLQHARIMMEAASSSRNYTDTQVKPLLETQLKYRFLPQSVPQFAATEQFNDLRKKYPDYAYKEATLNPTNPRDHATDWEVDVVNQLRQVSTRTEIVGAQVVSVPTSVSVQRANYTLKVFLLLLGAIFLFTIVMLNLMLYWVVIRRVKRLAKLADEVSLGNLDAGEFRTKSPDEIGVLTEAL